jgi:thiamine-monophosphate kinase
MGEFELLARLRERLPAAPPHVHVGIGDDAAITVPPGATATSVDALIEGVHFRREYAGLGQIGHKALAVALSDLAAMAAEPGEAYVVLHVPADLSEDGCIELLDGIAELAASTGTTLAGGDITRAPGLAVAITVVGHGEEPRSFVTRAGARAGEALVVTGELGGAAAGLLVLERPELGAGIPAELVEQLRGRQLEPQPRLAAGRALASTGASAMIDISDGLGGDARHLAAESGVGLRIDSEALPLAPGVAEIAAAAGLDFLQLAAGGGEDYELLATLPVQQLGAVESTANKAGTALTWIGEAVRGEGVEIRRPDGGLLEPAGFDQLG